MSRKKRHHHEEHEEHVNHEAWVIPYADMLTLLMAMFLVLWAIGQVDINKAKAVSTGFADELGLSQSAGRGAGGVGVLDGSAAPKKEDPLASRDKPARTEAFAAFERETEAKAAATEQRLELEDVQRRIETQARGVGFGGSLKFRLEARGLVVSIVSEGVLFDQGSAELRPEGRAILDGIAASLAGVPNDLAVEGHTDNVPISTAQFPSNWELSVARATAVLRYLVSAHGLAPNRLTAAGYADQRPIASNDSSAGRAQNRRVEIAVLGATEPVLDTSDQAAPQEINPGAKPSEKTE